VGNERRQQPLRIERQVRRRPLLALAQVVGDLHGLQPLEAESDTNAPGGRGAEIAVQDHGQTPARRRTPPRVKTAIEAIAAGMTASRISDCGVQPAASSTPPTSGPTMAPMRPTPSAQPTPVARMAVG